MNVTVLCIMDVYCTGHVTGQVTSQHLSKISCLAECSTFPVMKARPSRYIIIITGSMNNISVSFISLKWCVNVLQDEEPEYSLISGGLVSAKQSSQEVQGKQQYLPLMHTMSWY